MPLIKINGQEVEIGKGEPLIEAAKRIGVDIPFYCYHPGMKIVASCRMCLVDMVGAPKLVPACSTTVSELPAGKKLEDKYDAVVFTENDKVKTARASVLEFLLLNHPIDCPICDKAGECKLQDYSFDHGYDASRLVDAKRVPKRKDLGPSIFLYTSRCIMCTRCVRFTEEITGTEELKVVHRGAHAEIDIAPGRPLDNRMMGNVVDLCPVGCLIDKHEKFEGRVWNFVQTHSICPGCSKGCNTLLDTMKHQKLNLEPLVDKVYRIRPRENMDVNQWWICDDGRYLLEGQRPRVLVPQILRDGRRQETTWADALAVAAGRIQGAASETLFAGSPYASNEENYLLSKLAKALGSPTDVTPPSTGDTVTFKTDKNSRSFTIEAEKAPNFRGAKDVLGLTASTLERSLSRAKTVVMIGGSPSGLQVKPDFLVVLASYEDALTAQADVVLPMAMFAETSGTYTNKDGLTQKFNRAIQPAGQSRAAWQILTALAEVLGQSWYYETVGDLAKEMIEQVPAYRSINVTSLYPQLTYVDEQMVL